MTRRQVVWLLLGLAAFLGPVLPSLANTPPESARDLLLVVGAGVLAAAAVGAAYYLDRDPERPDRSPRTDLVELLRRVRRALGRARRVIAAVLVLAVFGLVVGPPVVRWAVATWNAGQGCPSPTELRVAAGPELVDVARAVGRGFEITTAGRNGGCPTASVSVYEADPDDVVERLTGPDGWGLGSGALLEIGPQPDLWLTGPVVDLPGAGDGAVREVQRVATSPVVVAVPAGSALADGAGGADRTWAETLDAVPDDGLGLVAADLRTTTTGLLAAVLTAGAGGGAVARLAALDRLVSRSLDDGGFPVGETDGLLCRVRRADAPSGAVAVIATERDVVRANRGDALPGACGREPAAQLLSALYPADARGFDVQLVRTGWTGQGERQRAAADELADWTSTDAGETALLFAGLRPADSVLLPSAPGLDPLRLPEPAAFTGPELAEADALLEQVQPRGRILFAVDTSGSMRADTPDGTRLDSAVRAVSATLELAGPRDELGLWLFPDPTGAAPERAVAVGPVELTRGAAGVALAAAVADEDTPLFRTMVEGIAAVRSGDPQANDVLVVVTDGEDTTSGIDASAVLAAARPDVRLVVVTIGDIRCGGAQLAALTAADQAVECRDADPGTLASTLAEVVEPYWSRS